MVRPRGAAISLGLHFAPVLYPFPLKNGFYRRSWLVPAASETGIATFTFVWVLETRLLKQGSALEINIYKIVNYRISMEWRVAEYQHFKKFKKSAIFTLLELIVYGLLIWKNWKFSSKIYPNKTAYTQTN